MSRAVVVGSGPNGLAAAVRLAQVGFDVQVYEAAEEIGGGTRSSDLLVDGVRHDHCSAFHPLGVASPFLSTLPLDRYGLQWMWPEIDCAHPLDDGTSALLYRDIETTSAGLGIDGRRWSALFGPLARRMEGVASEVLRPLPRLPRHPVALASMGMRALAPATLLARTMRTEQARALFTGMAAHGFTRLDRPGSAAAGALLVAAGHRHGWPVARGGSAAIAHAMAALLIDLGGSVTTGTAVRDLAEVGDAEIIILDVLPESAAQIMGSAMPTRLRRTFARRRPGAAAFKVDYVIDGDVGWTAPGCDRAGTVHLGGTAAEIAGAERQMLAGVMPERPFTLVGQQWLADPSRAKDSLRPLWAYAHVPAGYAGRAADAVTAQIERFAPGFTDRIVAVKATPPAELESANANYRSGDIGGGPNDLAHLVVRPRATLHPYATGAPGIYLCSSSTPPGGGVHGMCGFHAANAAIADVG